MKKQPIQPLYKDEQGVVRFKENKIVRYLLDKGGISMTDLAMVTPDFGQEDWEQFSQLIGYSLSGFGELNASNETFETAYRMQYEGKTEQEARIEYLQETLDSVRANLKELVPVVFRIHPDDLEDRE